jgi:hypothetical protein
MDEISGDSPLFTLLGGAAQYHYDTLESLKRYFSQELTYSLSRFDAFSGPRVVVRLADYMKETDLRSSLAILTSIEAAFQLDYKYRCRMRLKDDLSRAFRAMYKQEQSYVSLEKDIFDTWSHCCPR